MATNQIHRVVAIIPARGGSKGVARKNIRQVAGKPLIAYTIQAAQASQQLTQSFVSTEDAEIAKVAKALGSAVLMRPPELADDNTPMLPVVEHSLSVLEPVEGRQDYVVILQPTAPLRTAEDIDAAITLLIETGADSIVSVYQVFDHHPARMYLLANDRLVPYAPEPSGRLRQELPPVYHRNGAIYACRRSLIQEGRTLIGQDIRPYIMPRERSINIDDELDLAFVDFLLLMKKEST